MVRYPEARVCVTLPSIYCFPAKRGPAGGGGAVSTGSPDAAPLRCAFRGPVLHLGLEGGGLGEQDLDLGLLLGVHFWDGAGASGMCPSQALV